jgi:branched-chain amino acid transport system substrate-binding protein
MRMRSPVFFTNPAILALLTALTVPSASGQTQGVTNDSILIGSCSALDGPARFLGNQTVLGASAYLHSINDHGGVYGRKINLMAFDDGYDPEKAPECFKRMMKEGVFALGFFVGTPPLPNICPWRRKNASPS